MTPSDIGRRVSLRRRLADGRYGDVVGELLAWDAGRLAVRRRDGTEVTVAEADMVAGKVVPPAPPHRRKVVPPAPPHGRSDQGGDPPRTPA